VVETPLGVLARSVKSEGKGRAVSAARHVPEPENGGQQVWSFGGWVDSAGGASRAVLLRRARRAARLGVALEELARELAAARREVAVLRRENAALRSSLMSSALRD
jgi:hypothetical protein